MGDLTTVAKVKRTLEIGVNGTPNTVDDDLLQEFVTDTSQAIETYCKRQFSSTYGTLTWDARYPTIDQRKLYFDQDVLTVDFLINGANGTIPASDYRLLPTHFSPKYGLELLPVSNMVWVQGNDGFAANAITTIGSVGFCAASAQPTDITLAATKLAAWSYQNRDNDGAIVEMADGTKSIPAEAPQLVFKLLEKYVRKVAYQ